MCKTTVIYLQGEFSKMSAAEQACYTLINSPTESEPPNEMQLKQDLGESKFSCFPKVLQQMHL